MTDQAMTSTSTSIKLQALNIHKRFGSNEVLKGVSLTARAGDVISIIGSSGSGKSTFLRCINLLEKPHQGTIAVAGEALALVAGKNGELSARDPQQLQRLRTKLAMVFQHFNLWAHQTVLQNIIEAPVHVLGVPRDAAVATARKYLARVDLVGMEDRYPAHLSGGQQQRVAIARALVQEPEIILADEPVASLDPRNAEVVMQALAEINQRHGITVLCNLHSLDLARRYCTRLVGLAQGRLVFDDLPAALNDAAARTLYGTEAREVLDSPDRPLPDGLAAAVA
jgi:arginine/ornithine transport system ATP-binding protein